MDEEVYPKDIMGYYFSPKKRVYVGSVILKDIPGALAGAATALAKEGVNLVASESANIEGTETSNWGFFAEVEDSIDIEKIRGLIEATGYATKIDIIEGTDGVVVDRYHYPQVQLRPTGDDTKARGYGRHIQPHKEDLRLWGERDHLRNGNGSGESDAKELTETMGNEKVVRNLLDLFYLYSAQGWGLPEVVDLSLGPLRATIRFKDSFECVYAKSSTPNSHYVRGHLVGLAMTIFGKKIKRVETRCAAMGEPYCEFSAEEIW